MRKKRRFKSRSYGGQCWDIAASVSKDLAWSFLVCEDTPV